MTNAMIIRGSLLTSWQIPNWHLFTLHQRELHEAQQPRREELIILSQAKYLYM